MFHLTLGNVFILFCIRQLTHYMLRKLPIFAGYLMHIAQPKKSLLSNIIFNYTHAQPNKVQDPVLRTNEFDTPNLDQSGVKSNRQMNSNIQKTLNIINYCKTVHKNTLISAMGIYKLETDYLQLLLRPMGFGVRFHRRVQTLYLSPKVQLRINGF